MVTASAIYSGPDTLRLSPVSRRISRIPVFAISAISASISAAFSLHRVMEFLQLKPQ